MHRIYTLFFIILMPILTFSSYMLVSTTDDISLLSDTKYDGIFFLTDIGNRHYLVISKSLVEDNKIPLNYSIISDYDMEKRHYLSSNITYNKISRDKSMIHSTSGMVIFTSTDLIYDDRILPLETLHIRTLNWDKISKDFIQPPQFNQNVSDIVNDVSETEIETSIQDLQDFVTRYSYTDGCHLAGQYLANKMTGYGVDVETYHYIMGNLKSVYATTSSVAWCCGNHGMIFFSNDGGNLWREQENTGWPPEENIDMRDMDFAYIQSQLEYYGFIASDGGRIYRFRTSDGLWTELSTPVDTQINCVDAAESGLVLAGVSNGEILRSVDAGDNWEIISPGGYDWFRDISIIEDLNIAIIVGTGGVIFTSEDDGQTWVEKNSGVTSRIFSIEYNGQDTIYCLSENGVVLTSENDGDSWQSMQMDTDVSLRDIEFYGDYGYIAGDAGVLFATTDRGDTWERIYLDYYNQLYGVSVYDNTAWLVGSNGLILNCPDISQNNWIWQADNLQGDDPHVWENIIGRVEGSLYPDRVISVIAHYDSISDDPYNIAPGADDNASGTSCVVECCRVMANSNPTITVDFICFSGEELGLFGSSHYTRYLYLRTEEEIGTINMDMVAYVDASPEDLDLFSNQSSIWLLDYFISTSGMYVPGLPLFDRVFEEGQEALHSDHNSYWTHNYDAIFGIDDLLGDDLLNLHPSYPYYHTTNDVIDHLTMSFVGDVTRATVASLASMGLEDVGKNKDISDVFAYPNPFTPSNQNQRVVNFENVPEGGEVRIYTIAGQLVRTIQSNPTGKVVWYGDTVEGGDCPSGVYIYVAEGGGEEMMGKVVIVR